MRCLNRLLLPALLAAAATTAAAGTVSVSFVAPDRYWDAGNSKWDEDANLNALAVHLQRLGQRHLGADQALKIEVLQVDLAGRVRSFHGGSGIRVITGGTDWPRIQLRYVLEAGGRELARAEEWVSDMTYTQNLGRSRDNESLYHEKRMLDAWFKARFDSH